MINPDNNAAIKGKSIEVLRQRSAEVDGNEVFETDQQVNHHEDVNEPEFGLLDSKVYNEGNSNKSRRRNRRIDIDNLVTATDQAHQGLESLGADTLQITKDYVELPAAVPDSGHLVLESEIQFIDEKNGKKTTKSVESWEPRTVRNEADAEADGEATTTTKQVVAAADAWPARTLNTVSASRTQIGLDKFLQTVKVADSRPTLVSSEEEPMTGKKVTTTKTILDTAPAFADDGTPRFVTTVKHAGKDRWLKVVREIDDSILTTTYQEYHPVEYFFPSYLDEDQPFIILDFADDRTIMNTLKSSSQRLRVTCLFETTYHATLPTLSSIFQFKPVDITLRTTDGFIDERGVITDGATITITIDSNQTKLAIQLQEKEITFQEYMQLINGYEAEFEFPPSSPSTTEYKALMGTNVLIADDMIRWKYNLYRRTKVWMKIPDLDTNLDGNLNYS